MGDPPLRLGDLRSIISAPTAEADTESINSLKRKVIELEAAAAAGRAGRPMGPKAVAPAMRQPGEIGFSNVDLDVLRPDGMPGSYMSDHEQFGKAYWLKHAENVIKLKDSPIYRFLIQLSSYTNKTPEEFTQSLLYNDFLNDVSVLAALATNSPEALVNKLDDEDTTHRRGASDPVRLTGLSAMSSSSSHDKPFSRLAGDIVKQAAERLDNDALAEAARVDPAQLEGAAGDAEKQTAAEREARERRATQLLLELVRNENRPERHFNKLDRSTKRDLLYSLLASGTHSKVDMEIIEKLFPKKVRPELNWILHPQIGGMVFVTDEIVGRVRDCINTLNIECGEAFPVLTESQIIAPPYLEQTARWVAASRNLVNRNRFTMSQAANNRLERDREIAMAALCDLRRRVASHGAAITPMLTQTQRLAEFYGIGKYLRT